MADAAGITGLLRAWTDGHDSALADLTPLVEAELRRVARQFMKRERADHTLQATALVNEAFLRLARARGVQWQDRSHFVAIAARLMRRVLIDHARARAFGKRGGGERPLRLDESSAMTPAPDLEILALDRALDALADLDPRKARVVEMRYFGGLSVDETAAALKVSADTVKRDWRLAKLWLLQAMVGRRD